MAIRKLDAKIPAESQELIFAYAGGVVPRGVSKKDWKQIFWTWVEDRMSAYNPDWIRTEIKKYNTALSCNPRPWQIGGRNGSRWH